MFEKYWWRTVIPSDEMNGRSSQTTTSSLTRLCITSSAVRGGKVTSASCGYCGEYTREERRYEEPANAWCKIQEVRVWARGRMCVQSWPSSC